MATKKKKTTKKKTTKKKSTRKKATKKKATKKKATKKKAPQKTAPRTNGNNGKMHLEVIKGGKVDNGPKSVWSVILKGKNGNSIPADLVTATNKTEALKKARRILRSNFV
ncbi:MAG: hypothetical protein ACYSWP_14995 [Planctomycetota bacterium]|jgi:hypothetical protein